MSRLSVRGEGLDTSEDDWTLRTKYGLDRLAAVTLILLIAPLLVAVSVLIKLEDGGPVFFTQTRIGQGKNGTCQRQWDTLRD